jgi:hypothetical protein
MYLPCSITLYFDGIYGISTKKKKKKKHACFSYDLARSDMDVIEHSTDETQGQKS